MYKIRRGSQEGPVIETCLSAGLWHAGASMNVGGTHIANWLIGQVRDNSLTEEKIRSYAHEIEIDETEMVEAFYDVPYMEKERFEKIVLMLDTVVNILSRSAFENFQKTQLIEKLRYTEDVLQHKEAYLKTLIRTIPDLVWLKDTEGVYLLCNSRFEDLFGDKEENIIGKTDYDFVEKELADFFRRNDLLAIAEGKPTKNEETVTFVSDGHQEILETIKTPVYNDAGRLMGVLGIGHDITLYRQVETERVTNLTFLENLDRVNRAMHGSDDFEQLMNSVLDEVLSIFLCDRAFLLYPCDPEALEWEVPVERTVPEYPGMFEKGEKLPMTPEVLAYIKKILATDSVIAYTVENGLKVDEELNKSFHIQSLLSIALHPKTGSAWQFGIQQCSYPRIWTEEEKRLFQEIGRRMGDALTSLLMHRNVQNNEQLLNNILENIPNMIIMKDVEELRVVKFNRAGEELMGYSREELLGKNDYDFFPKALADFFTERDREVLRAKQLLDIPEDVTRTKDNQKLIVHTKKIPILDEHGIPQFLFAITEDITEYKQAEYELKETKERLQSFMESATDSITIYDASANLVEINKKALSYFPPGSRKSDLIGKNIVDLSSSFKKEGTVVLHYREVLHSGEPFLGEEVIEREGRTLWFNVKIFNVGEGLGVLTSEITAQKMAEQEIIKVSERLQSFMDSATDIMSVWDSDFYLQLINNAALAYFPPGTRKENLQGKHITEFKYLYGDTPLPERFQEVLMSGKPSITEDMIHLEIESCWFNFRIFKVGEGIGTIINDITEKKKLEEQLSQVQKIESIGRLAGGVAHDYNNMLGVIIGHTDLALQMVKPEQPLYEYLHEIMIAAERSAELTHQLLAFARKQAIAPQMLDLNTTLSGMLKMLRALIGEYIELVWKPGDELWPVRMDPSQLDQLLANLCVNARDAIQETGMITIETRNMVFDKEYCAYHPECVSGDFVMLSVNDNGRGMDRKTRDMMFEPFFTTKSIGKGTGLGLATVYGIVKQNNGFINVYSEPGVGTSLKLFFPRQFVEKEEAAQKVKTIPLPGGQETVLLVEDEPVILNMAKLMLERMGYNVLAISDPEEAIQVSREYHDTIDLLISDVVMPNMNGSQLAREIVSLYPRIKCLFMSGYTDNLIAHHGVLEEGVHFIQKPFSMQALAEKVRETLEES